MHPVFRKETLLFFLLFRSLGLDLLLASRSVLLVSVGAEIRTDSFFGIAESALGLP